MASKKRIKSSPIIVLSLLIALVLIWFLFYDFSFGRKAIYSPIYEYSVILFIFAFYYSSKNKKLLILTTVLAAFYIIFDFLGGQRSTGFQILIVIFINFLYKWIRVKEIVFIAVFGIILLNVVAVFRGSGSFSVSNVNIGTVIKDTFSSGFSSDTSSYAYYSSMVYLYARQYFTGIEIFYQFAQYVASLIVVGGVGRSITDIALDYHYHFYGGVLPLYIYYYLGFFGVVMIGLLVGFYFKSIYNYRINGVGFSHLLAIYITATSIRWYLYSPNQLFRGVLLLLIIYLVLNSVNNMIRRFR